MVKKPYWGYVPQELKDDRGALDEVIRSHLEGRETHGFYSHSSRHTCKWICLDLDLKQGLIERQEVPTFITANVKNWLEEEAKAITAGNRD